MDFITQAKSKRKFYYKNILDENSKADLIKQYSLLKSKRSQPTLSSLVQQEYKPIFLIETPKNDSQQITFPSSTTKRSKVLSKENKDQNLNSLSIPTQISHFNTEQPQRSQIRRINIKKKQITQFCGKGIDENQELDLLDYLNFVKYTNRMNRIQLNESISHREKSDHSFTMNHLNKIHFKSVKNELLNYLNKLYYIAYSVYSIIRIKSINLQDIVDLYLDYNKQRQSSQFSYIENIIEQFIIDLEIASRIYNSTKVKASSLAKINGMDHKLFHLLYRNKKDNNSKIHDYIIDENFNNIYQMKQINKIDIYYRILGSGDLPLEYQEQLQYFQQNIDYQPKIMMGQFKDKDYQLLKNKYQTEFGFEKQQWINNKHKIEIDLDFIRRLLYYQKNLQQALKQKQQDIISNKANQLQQYKKKKFRFKGQEDTYIPEQETILNRLEQTEESIGGFPLVSRQNRMQYENLDTLTKVQQNIQ